MPDDRLKWFEARLVDTRAMLRSILLMTVLSGTHAPPGRVSSSDPPPETVIIDCPGLRCAACQFGVLRGSRAFAGVRSVDFDPRIARLTITVDPGFDRHHELVAALQRVADPIEMFRVTLVEPRQVFLYLDRPLDLEQSRSLSDQVKSVSGVRSVHWDQRGVLSIAMGTMTNRAEILKCVQSLGYRGEIFETRYETNLESRYSESSHHLIGILILIMSFLFILDLATHGRTRLGIAVSSLWILGGVLVLVLSDIDSWPYLRSLGDSLKDKMIVQHKILGLGMVFLGVAEARRRRQKGWRYGPLTLFLAISIFSGVMLQYHFPNMVDPAHVKAWRWVNRQHLVAAIVGGAALAARAAHECRIIKRPSFAYAWPILLGVEGALLCMFLEPVW